MQKQTALIWLLLIGCWFSSEGQERYFTKTGRINFLSNAPLESIEAVNKTAGAVFDRQTGAVQAVVLMRGFEFKKALMQEHFNENYVESHKYPNAELRGTIANYQPTDYARDGTYTATIKGRFQLHGITKDITLPVSLTLKDGRIQASSVFYVLLSDYGISIPSLVKDKVSNQVKVTASFILEPLKP